MSRREISTDSCSIIWLCYLTCDVWRENTSSNSTPCSQHYVQEEDETVTNLRRRENCNVMDSSFLWGQTVRRNLCSTPRTNHLTHNTVVVITCIYKVSTIVVLNQRSWQRILAVDQVIQKNEIFWQVFASVMSKLLWRHLKTHTTHI